MSGDRLLNTDFFPSFGQSLSERRGYILRPTQEAGRQVLSKHEQADAKHGSRHGQESYDAQRERPPVMQQATSYSGGGGGVHAGTTIGVGF